MGLVTMSKVHKWKAVRGIKPDTLLQGTEVSIEEGVPHAEDQMVVRSIELDNEPQAPDWENIVNSYAGNDK